MKKRTIKYLRHWKCKGIAHKDPLSRMVIYRGVLVTEQFAHEHWNRHAI